ncbi:MAG: DUF4446 family protein [Candidatus Moraniibacteriota bacterium]
MNALQNLLQTRLFVFVLLSMICILLLLIVGFFWLFMKIRALQKRQNALFDGQPSESAENILLRHSEEINTLDAEIQELFEISNKLHQLGQKGLHRIGFVRFNPFKDVGSNQSFSLALLDGKNNGVVVSSLHTRDASRVYAKPIENSTSPTPLTDEEKKALSLANQQVISIRDTH